MRPETRQSLADARAVALEVREIAVGPWETDRTVALAVERLLITLGEALSRIRSVDPDTLDRVTDSHKIIAMRNVLVHGYDALDPLRIRAAVEQSLPLLISEVESLVGES